LVPTELARSSARVGDVAEVATTHAAGDRDEVLLPVDTRVSSFPRWGSAEQGASSSLRRWITAHAADYDVLHIHGVFSVSTIVASRAAARRGVPYVITPHGMLDRWALSQKRLRKRAYLHWVGQPIFARAAAAHALTPRELTDIRHQGMSTPTFVLPNGIDATQLNEADSRRFRDTFPPARDRDIVLFLGRLHQKKGIDVLIDAFAAAWPARRRPLLVVAGPGSPDFRGNLERRATLRDLHNDILFTGELTGELKVAALKACDVFVLPSRSEGFSVSILEALAAGKPVVVTTSCNFPEIASAEAGVVIPPDDIRALRDALVNVMADATGRHEMGTRARRLVASRYDAGLLATQLRAVYRDILDDTRRSPAWSHDAGAAR